VNLLIDAATVRRWFVTAKNDVRRAAEYGVRELRDRAGRGDEAADKQLEAWTLGGARQDLKRVYLADNQVAVGTNGSRTTLPRMLSIRQPDGSRQLTAWEFMSREAFEAALAEYEAQTEKRTKTLAILRRVLAAWDECPEAETAAEAAAFAGIDLTALAEDAA